jgi:TolB-like protein/Tfp pilus assembly protein PilF
MGQTGSTDAGRLDSWKEIAAYLRRGARTVQRWERTEGLPVRRLPHAKLGSVYAFKAARDEWFARGGPALAEAAAPARPSVAVLPFADLSPEADQAYFCDGIAEEITNTLSRVDGLRTASRSSSFRFRTAGADGKEVGRELGVASLLVGSVRKAGERLRITVELVDAAGGVPLWRERYDRAMGDIFAIQDQIAEKVAQALEVQLGASRAPATSDVDAYDCYLRGRRFYYEYGSGPMEQALRMFVRAIEIDPNYARAYAGLADCWSYLYLYSDRSDAVRERADWASLKAQEMDPQSAQAQASRGLSLSLSGRVKEADRAFAAAARLDPGLFEAHYFYARHCFVLGRLPEALEAYDRAMEARPDDYQSPLLSAQIADDLGQHDRAASLRRRGIGIAERRLQSDPNDARAYYMAANGLAALGERERSRQMAERAAALRPDDPMLLYNVGCVFSMLGLTGPALDCLEKAARSGLTQRGWYEHDSNLEAVRQEPRFHALLKSLS